MNHSRKGTTSKNMGLGLMEYVSKAKTRLALPWTGLAGLRLSHAKLYDVYGSTKKQLSIAQKSEDLFGADFTGIMDDGIICSETLGMKIKTYDFDFPAVEEHPVKNRQALSCLAVPDPLTDGRMAVNIASIRALAERSDKPVAISIEGPFTLAGQLAGVEDLARAIITDPEFVTLLLDFTSQVVKAYAQSASRAGADLISIAEPTSIILSSQQFDTFVVPVVQKVFQGLGAWKVMHICGDTSHLLDAMLLCGPEGLSLDQVMDIPSILKRVPDNIVVFGNIDPLDVMLEMDPEGVAQATSSLLAAVDSHANFIMSTGCDCVLETRFDNIKTLISTTHNHPWPPVEPPFQNSLTADLAPPLVPMKKETVLPPKCKANDLITQIRQAVIDFDSEHCRSLCQKTVASGMDPLRAIDRGLAAGMEEAGNLFSDSIYFIPELLLCTDTLYAGLEELKPHISFDELKVKAKLVIGVVEGDIHEIGKNLVVAMFTAAGWEVLDLGKDVDTATFVKACGEHNPDLVGISALMSTSMRRIPVIIEALREQNSEVKILVGGAPLTREKALAFQADGYAVNAVRAVQECIKLISTSGPSC